MPSVPPSKGMPEMPPEQALMELGMAHQGSRVLSTSVQLGVFSQIGKNAKTADEIARGVQASARAMRMLLDSLVGIQLLSKQGDKYSLRPVASQFLCKESPDYVGAMYESDHLWDVWGKLPEIVRTGKPAVNVEKQAGAEAFFPILIKSLHVMNREPAKVAARALGAGGERRGQRVLDVACGSAVWSLAFAAIDREAKVTAQDFPNVLEHTRGFVKRHEMETRYEYLAGDLKKVEFGSSKYDVAILGNIVHSEGEKSSRDLFKRLHRALAPGGKIAIVDMIPNEERTGPPFALFFALTMLVNTDEGSTYTLGEYTRWLKDAGFARVETADIHSHSPLVIGIKA